MTRIKRDLEIEPPDRLDATIELIIGPCLLSEKQLEVAWEAYGDEITGWQHRADASRPWGYWRFVLGEEMPRAHWNPDTHQMEEKHAGVPRALAQEAERSGARADDRGDQREEGQGREAQPTDHGQALHRLGGRGGS